MQTVEQLIKELKIGKYTEIPRVQAHYRGMILAVPTAVELLVEACYGAGLAAGWWHDPKTKEPKPDRNYGELCALMHSEISESFEAYRKGLQDDHLPQYSGQITELVDVAVRLFDAVGGLGKTEEFCEAFAAKMEYNATREDHKIENRAAEGGKKV